MARLMKKRDRLITYTRLPILAFNETDNLLDSLEVLLGKRFSELEEKNYSLLYTGKSLVTNDYIVEIGYTDDNGILKSTAGKLIWNGEEELIEGIFKTVDNSKLVQDRMYFGSDSEDTLCTKTFTFTSDSGPSIESLITDEHHIGQNYKLAYIYLYGIIGNAAPSITW